MLSSTDCRTPELRHSARSSIYLGAVLYCDGQPTPIRVRNMSSSGAMIEGAVLPEVGAMIQLVRGTLIVHGLIMWVAGHRCGLQFLGSVDVSQWQANPRNVQQQRVDEIVRLVKAGAVPLPVPGLGPPPPREDSDEAGEEVPQDLRRVAGLLDQLGEALAGDPDVILRHSTALQNLDIAGQVLTALMELMTGQAERGSGGGKLEGLRRSADQALLREA